MATHPHFKLRIGIDMGQVSLASEGGIVVDVFGRQVNRAARIQSLAEPEHVLTSFHVYDCAVGWLRQPSVSWHNHGAAELKGFSDRVSIHEPFDPQFTRPQSLELPGHAVHAPRERIMMHVDVLHELGADLASDTATASVTPGAFRLQPLTAAPKGDPLAYYRAAIAKIIPNLQSDKRGRPAILWVDDHPSNNARETQVLVQAGCIVDLALSTDEALRQMQSRQYALLITDMARDQNATAGIEILQVMRRSAIHTPVLVYSSSRAAALYNEQATANGALLCTAGTVTLLDAILQVIGRMS